MGLTEVQTAEKQEMAIAQTKITGCSKLASSNTLHNSGSLSNSREDQETTELNQQLIWSDVSIKNNVAPKINKLKSGYKPTDKQSAAARKPVVVKHPTNANIIPSIGQQPGQLGITHILENTPVVKGMNSSRKEYQQSQTSKSNTKGMYPKKQQNKESASTQGLNGNTTDRFGSSTDRISEKNEKTIKRGNSSIGNRSTSKNQNNGGKYQIKTFSDFLTSSKIQKNPMMRESFNN